MRLSRNRNWGHPNMVAFLKTFAADAKAKDGWPGLLVGDMSQPRGGPMLTGHASHQIGLDADLWLTPMPDRVLSAEEREKMEPALMVAADKVSIDPQHWSAKQAALIKRAASYPQVERIFVNPAIKKALCEAAPSMGADKSWLAKVRPLWGHDYHFHVRLHCPEGSAHCKPQQAVTGEDGCGAELTHWLKLVSTPPKPDPNAKPAPPPKPVTLDQLPGECRAVLTEGDVPAAVRAAAAKAEPAKPEAAKSAPAPVPGAPQPK
jgi:penicillin-insensitive murein endopeptidase